MMGKSDYISQQTIIPLNALFFESQTIIKPISNFNQKKQVLQTNVK